MSVKLNINNVDFIKKDGTKVSLNTVVDKSATEAIKEIEKKGNEVLQSIPKDFTTQMQSKLDKNQGAENAGKALVIGEDGNVVPGEVQGGGDGIAIINTMSSVSPLAIPDSAERPIKGFNIIGNTVQNQEPPPSPDHPQEIKSVGKWNETKQKYEVEVRVTGNNILNMQIEPDTKGTYQGWKVGDGKKKITLSIIDKGNNKDISNCYFGLSGNGTDQKDGVAWLIESGKITKTKTTSLNPYVTIFPSDETAQRKILERFDIQCEFGEIQTEYQPYKEQTLTLTSERPITKWDKLVEQDGQIGWLYQSAIKTFKDDVFKLYSDNEKAIQYQIPFEEITGSWEESVCYCNTFENVKGNLIYMQSAGKDFYMGCMQKAMVFSAKTKQGIFASLEAFQQWIRNSDTYVLHKTNTTEFVPLQQSEQDAIRALKTYYPTTVITVDGGEVYGGVEVTYTADTKNYIDQKIAAIGKTVVETQKALL